MWLFRIPRAELARMSPAHHCRRLSTLSLLPPRPPVWLRWLTRFVFYVCASIAIVFFLLMLAVRLVVVPRVGDYREDITALIAKGLLKVQNFKNSKNKRAYAYLLTPGGIQEKARVTLSFLDRKTAEYEALQHEIDVLRREAAIELAFVAPPGPLRALERGAA